MSEAVREELVLHIGCVIVGLLACGPALTGSIPFGPGTTLGLLLVLAGILGLCALLRERIRVPRARAARRPPSRYGAR
ncbi:MAG: hypothetical protein JWP01_2976 [Myxococcales bacterium]|nr:hypothetical protein [Myxococcales bacterium]